MARTALEIMNDLIQLDIDALRAYEQAITACDIPLIQQQLTSFKGDHERHVTELSALVQARGLEPRNKRDWKGFLIEGFTAIASRGDHSALSAMRGNEVLTNRTYQMALEEIGVEELEARALIVKNFADEKRHLAWIKDALDRKIYQKAA